ncbi:hypothetical protein CHARACLAT_018602 [Characodon lateralis]|uniref:Secreted protein n=1 Tax=Characodon lateralis TaxID=208331 RepID=A0ABU7EC30_9TELE|nr:hypothetical protein [Characodon lateralis]
MLRFVSGLLCVIINKCLFFSYHMQCKPLPLPDAGYGVLTITEYIYGNPPPLRQPKTKSIILYITELSRYSPIQPPVLSSPSVAPPCLTCCFHNNQSLSCDVTW